MYKALLHETWTKRDLYGNVYHTVRVTNPKTEKSFTTSTCSMGNVEHILYEIFKLKSGKYPFYSSNECTGSARLSSLPDHHYLNECNPDGLWLRALRDIGYRIPKTDK